MKRHRVPKTSELIARDLVTQMIDSELQEGARLPPEKAMVESFGAGRTTVREALRLLETRGVITIRPGPGGGPIVRRPRPEDLGEALTLILEFEGASLADVVEARQALEPMTARLAAVRITKEHLGVLASTIDDMLEDVEDHERFLRNNAIFHSTVAEASGSVVVQVFNASLKAIADGASAGVQYTPARRRAVAEAHSRILAALEAGDQDASSVAMFEHLAEAESYWRRKYGQLIIQPVRWVR